MLDRFQYDDDVIVAFLLLFIDRSLNIYLTLFARLPYWFLIRREN